MINPIRKRFFIAVEGVSEESFMNWLYAVAVKAGVLVHLDVRPLRGGSYKKMLGKALVAYARSKSNNGEYHGRFLLVDADRAGVTDWQVEELRKQAAKARFKVCLQRPNHEGLLLRMFEGKEKQVPSAASAKTMLKRLWPEYVKGVSATKLGGKFQLQDIQRLSKHDDDIALLLKTMGL